MAAFRKALAAPPDLGPPGKLLGPSTSDTGQGRGGGTPWRSNVAPPPAADPAWVVKLAGKVAAPVEKGPVHGHLLSQVCAQALYGSNRALETYLGRPVPPQWLCAPTP